MAPQVVQIIENTCKMPDVLNQHYQKYTLCEITIDKYLYLYPSRQNGVFYVNRTQTCLPLKIYFNFYRRLKVEQFDVDDSRI